MFLIAQNQMMSTTDGGNITLAAERIISFSAPNSLLSNHNNPPTDLSDAEMKEKRVNDTCNSSALECQTRLREFVDAPSFSFDSYQLSVRRERCLAAMNSSKPNSLGFDAARLETARMYIPTLIRYMVECTGASIVPIFLVPPHEYSIRLQGGKDAYVLSGASLAVFQQYCNLFLVVLQDYNHVGQIDLPDPLSNVPITQTSTLKVDLVSGRSLDFQSVWKQMVVVIGMSPPLFAPGNIVPEEPGRYQKK